MAQKKTVRTADTVRIRALVREMLVALGEDPDREGLVKTPQRVAEALAFLTSGNRTNLEQLVGRCHIGYIPTGKVFGVSKLARLADMYARRLQLQERLTEQISQAVMETVGATGVGVMIEAQHLCMMMRGVEKQNSVMVTSSVLGAFRESQATREEFLALIGQRGA